MADDLTIPEQYLDEALEMLMPDEGKHRVLVLEDSLGGNYIALLAHRAYWTAPFSLLESDEPPKCPGCGGSIADN